MLCMVLGLLLCLRGGPLVVLGSSCARAPCGVWSCKFSCSWLLLGMGSNGRYALTGALVCGDLRDDCGDFPWAGGGSGIVWSLVFHVEL